MITLKDLHKGYDYGQLPNDVKANLVILENRLFKLEQLFGKEFVVTSGFRSMADHLRIYKEKGVTDPDKIPMKSKHLSGRAADIFDEDGSLTRFCKSLNSDVLVNCMLWAEDDQSVPRLHLQIIPPASSRRWFLP